MSRTIKKQLRVLVKEHERGLLPDPDYRRLRRALLQRAARGETHAAEEPTATRPREPQAPPPDSPPQGNPTTTKPRSTAKEQRLAAAAPRTASGRKDRNASDTTSGFRLPLVVAGVVVLFAAITAAVLLGGRGDSPSPVAAPSPPSDDPYVHNEAKELVAEFIERDDWSPENIQRLRQDWDELPEDARANAKFEGWFRELARELRDRLKLSELAAGDTPTMSTAELKSLASSLDLRVQSRFETAAPASAGGNAQGDDPAASAPEAGADTPPTKSDALPTQSDGLPAALPEPDISKAGDDVEVEHLTTPVESAAPSNAGAKEPPPIDEKASTTAPTLPALAVATAAKGSIETPAANAPPAETSAARPRGSQCGSHLLNTRRKYCRDVLADGSTGPKLALVRPGRFDMGSSMRSEEQPVREVAVSKAFAIGVNEVTFAEYRAFCDATGRSCPDNPWGDDSLPVINVSWTDASAYAGWIAQRSGQPYRLPTEAEWEFAARAGTTSDFPFGDKISYLQAHFSDTKAQTAPLAADAALIPGNRLGLKHIVGNVSEWVQDVWMDSHAGAPTDGSARTAEDGSQRVVRGGSYRNRAADLRSAARLGLPADEGAPDVGIRLARSID